MAFTPSVISAEDTSFPVPPEQDRTRDTVNPNTDVTNASSRRTTGGDGDTKFTTSDAITLVTRLNTMSKQLSKLKINNHMFNPKYVGDLSSDCRYVSRSIQDNIKSNKINELHEPSENLYKLFRNSDSSVTDFGKSILSLKDKMDELGLKPKQGVELINMSAKDEETHDQFEDLNQCVECVASCLDWAEKNQCQAACCCSQVMSDKQEPFWKPE